MLTILPKPNFIEYVREQAKWNAPGEDSHFVEVSRYNLGQFMDRLDHAGVNVLSLLSVGCRDCGELDEIRLDRPEIALQGVDLLEDHVDRSRANGYEAIVGDIHKLPFADQSWDAVYCSQTLEHSHTPSQAAGELFRVARKAVFIGVPYEKVPSPSHYVYTEDPEDWLAFLAEASSGWSGFSYKNLDSPYLNVIFTRSR